MRCAAHTPNVTNNLQTLQKGHELPADMLEEMQTANER
jgi:hypothetical protein